MKLPVEEFLKKRKEAKPSFVFDLREMDEYEKGHLAGAYNLPFEHLESNLQRLPFSGEMLFYDGGEGNVVQAAAMLEENGFSDFFYAEEGHETLEVALKDSPHAIKLFTTKDDPPEVQKEVIQNLLDFEINPRVASHGGFFTLMDVSENNVYVELGGGCQGCGMADVTLRQSVEQRMREVFPDMVELIDNTEHSEGTDPYYSGGK